MRTRKQSPWGQVDYETNVADGIVSVSTPSHGGYLLSKERAKAVYQRFPAFKTFCGDPLAFEEDQDWAAVALTFPEFFSEDAVEIAMRTARQSMSFASPDSRWRCVVEWLDRRAALVG